MVKASLEMNNSSDKGQNKAVTRLEYHVSDGYTFEKQEFLLVDPTGIFEDKEKDIQFEGYPIRQYKSSINHGWLEDLVETE